MTKDEFYQLGFTTETLANGNINVINTVPFIYNGITTITCFSGKYIRTVDVKSLDDLLSNAKQLELITDRRLSNKDITSNNKNNKEPKEKKNDVLEPETYQSLADFLFSDSDSLAKNKKPNRTRKSKIVS